MLEALWLCCFFSVARLNFLVEILGSLLYLLRSELREVCIVALGCIFGALGNIFRRLGCREGIPIKFLRLKFIFYDFDKIMYFLESCGIIYAKIV